ncbi:ABC transporter substrate-binding protein [Paenibacillus apiarius]|uniref:ABC transporter substrate-binding protein n=1 Tax=Paenibacillus apiarius TaxID=46240 RepID=UPI003B3B009A
MNTWKKMLVLFLALAMMVVAAACSRGNSATKETPGGAGGDAAVSDTVKVWTYPVHQAYEDELKQLIPEFMKQHPNIKVEFEVLSWAEGPKKFDVALNAGNPPDIYYGGLSGAYVNTGMVVPLDGYLTQEIKDDYEPGILEFGQIQGKQYMLPLTSGQWEWGGNKRILEEAGIDWKSIQQNGWSWTEFTELAKKMTKKLPDNSMQYGVVTDGTSLDFSQLITKNAGLVDLVDESGKFIWNDDRILDSLNFVDSLMKDGIMPKETGALTPQQRTQMFYDGKAAIISKAIPYYDTMIANRNKDIDAGKANGEKIEFILLPVPHHDKHPAKTYTTSEGYMMFQQKNGKDEQHLKNVFLVLDFLTGAQGGNSSNELCLPFTRKSQAKAFEDKGKATQHNWDAAVNFSQNPAPSVENKVGLDVSSKMKQFREQVQKPAFQALFAGEKTPQQIAEEFKAKGEQMFGG